MQTDFKPAVLDFSEIGGLTPFWQFEVKPRAVPTPIAPGRSPPMIEGKPLTGKASKHSIQKLYVNLEFLIRFNIENGKTCAKPASN